MKNDIKTFAQSCDSRECRKKYKKDLNDICDFVTTVHTFNRTTKVVTCTECGKSYKLTKT